MKYTDNWFVFWVKTGYEQKAADEIVANFDGEVVYQQLLIETFFRKQGKVKKETKIAFPGYIIISTVISNDEFLRRVSGLNKSKFIIKLLCYGESNQATMRKEERGLIECLWQDDICIGASKGFIKGDNVVVTDGPFVGRESVIKSINRHKRQAVIEIEFMGSVRQITICLEIIEKLIL